MSQAPEAHWGESYFEREKYLVPPVRVEEGDMTTREEFALYHEDALADPAYDLFEHKMPTGRPKRDIGRYVMRYGINVPLVRSLQEWDAALMNGQGMLRSELRQDYSGFSGLLRTLRIPVVTTYPRREDGFEGYEREWTSRQGYVDHQLVAGPVEARILLDGGMMNRVDHTGNIGGAAVTSALHDTFAAGLRDGTINPTAMMRHLHWNDQVVRHYTEARERRYTPAYIEEAWASHWRFVPGVNVRIMRDPVIEGKYFIGGNEAHHHWEITEGADSDDIKAFSKSVYRGRGGPGEQDPEYLLPTSRIVKLYERVRTLPYFDNRQAPLMELQYGEDGKLYFLQYLKTGLQLGDPGAFELPSDPGTVTVDDVRGATKPEGAATRIYLDPRRLSQNMEGQAVYVGYNLAGHGNVEQIAAMRTRFSILDDALNFKDNHFSSAGLTRAAVAIGLWDDRGEGEERFKALATPNDYTKRGGDDRHIDYIDAHITSNGRQAAIASDWILKHELLN